MLNSAGLAIGSGVDVVAMAEKWESDAPGMFEVSVDGDTAEARLQDFVREVSLNEGLLGNTSEPSSANVSFYALSLMADGTPVEVSVQIPCLRNLNNIVNLCDRYSTRI